MGFVTIQQGKSRLANLDVSTITLQPTLKNGDNVPFVAIRIPIGCGFVILDGSDTACFTLIPALNDDDEAVYDQS